MCENVFYKGSETIFTNKAFRMLTGLRHYKLLDTEMYDDSVSVKVSSNMSYAKCPICGKPSHSVHSHYERHLLTLPMYDKAMYITFVARRFRCRNPDCECKRFAEQPSDLVSRYCRRTTSLDHRLTIMSVQMSAMRCEEISRMVKVPISASTSLRLVRSIDTTPDRTSVKNFASHEHIIIQGIREGEILKDIWQDLWNDGLKMNYATLLRYLHNSYPEYKSPKGGHKGGKVDNRKALKAMKQCNKSPQSRPTNMLILGKLNIYVCNPDYGINKATGECTKDHILYNQAIAQSPILTELRESYISFRETLKGGDAKALDIWIRRYSESRFTGISIFAKHMTKDIDAIRNAIRYRYSNGIAEGLNNKIKAIKREMYGRARKDLLEKKLIASALT